MPQVSNKWLTMLIESLEFGGGSSDFLGMFSGELPDQASRLSLRKARM